MDASERTSEVIGTILLALPILLVVAAWGVLIRSKSRLSVGQFRYGCFSLAGTTISLAIFSIMPGVARAIGHYDLVGRIGLWLALGSLAAAFATKRSPRVLAIAASIGALAIWFTIGFFPF